MSPRADHRSHTFFRAFSLLRHRPPGSRANFQKSQNSISRKIGNYIYPSPRSLSSAYECLLQWSAHMPSAGATRPPPRSSRRGSVWISTAQPAREATPPEVRPPVSPAVACLGCARVTPRDPPGPRPDRGAAADLPRAGSDPPPAADLALADLAGDPPPVARSGARPAPAVAPRERVTQARPGCGRPCEWLPLVGLACGSRLACRMCPHRARVAPVALA